MSDSLTELQQKIAGCTDCRLYESRTNAVPGEGPEDAEILLIGEGPGFHEDKQGRPFVGAAGKFLDELLEQIGLSRQEVFITNLVKCRPPGNRDPQPDELQICTTNYLDKQIKAINPKVIVTLGRYSMARYFPNAKISQIHGSPKKIDSRLIIPMYHPAAALHQPSLREVVEADFARIPEILADSETVSDTPAAVDDDAEQLSLF